MTRLVLRGLAARKLRSALTAIAILLGVAMISGTFVLTDQITNAFNGIFSKINAGTDVTLSQRDAFKNQNGNPTAEPLREALIARVAKVDGVARATGQLGTSGQLVVNGKVASTTGAPSFVISLEGAPFDTGKVVDGRYPRSTNEIAINRGLAKKEHVGVGDRVGLATVSGTQAVTIAGIYTVSGEDSLGGANVVVGRLPDVQRWAQQAGLVTKVDAQAKPGVSPSVLKARIEQVVPRSVLVETGVENADKQAKDINDAIGGFLTPALLAFAGVAVLVGAFIIFNTFSITVAQRVREFGMLRTLGATRRQVLTSVIGEALVISIIASVVGILAGLGVALGIDALFSAVGFGIPTSSPSLTANAIVWGLVVGVGVTMLASIGPARRATKIAPIAALREGATIPPGRLSRLGPYLSPVVGLLGIAALAAGVFGSGNVSNRLLIMAVGAILVFVGVALVARYLVRPLARTIGAPLAALGGVPGRLAQENAIRNPARTAVTSASLMIGIGLVAFVSIFAEGLKHSINDAINNSIRSNVVVTSSDNSQQVVPAGAIAAAARAPGVADATGIESGLVQIGGNGTESVNGIDPARFGEVYRFKWRRGGADALLGQLGSNGALVEKDLASSRKLTVGKTFSVLNQAGRRATYRVLGEYEDNQLMTGFIVSNRAYDSLFTHHDPQVILVRSRPGVDDKAAAAAVKAAVSNRFPIAKVQTNSEYKGSIADQVNTLLTLLYALLAMSILISLFGIVNTLVLSIFERTREIGMLRAIGTTRRQVRRMVRYESVITSVIGGVLGILIGMVFAWIVIKGVGSSGITFGLPVVQLVVFLIVAVIAGILAAILPARRASRLDVLQALQYE